MANNIIDSIRLSGTTYQIQGGSIAVDTELDSGSTNPVQNKVIYNKIDEVEEVTAAGLNALDAKINPTVELTQAEYEALTEKDPNTYYIITDAEAGDLTNYYTKSETNTLLGGKQDTLISGTNIKTINNESILGSGNIDIQGGGSSYTAGRGIDITNDTISFSLPISAGTGTNALVMASDTYNISNKAKGDYSVCLNGGGYHPNYAYGTSSLAEGMDTKAYGNACHSEGLSSKAGVENNNYIQFAHAEGDHTQAKGTASHTEGFYTIANGNNSHAEGQNTQTNNPSEHASGQYNVSSSASTTFGNSGNTLFSVGNGTAINARHNAFEVRQNGDIYLSLNGQDVKLQDQLGGSSITVDTALDSGSTNPVENRVIYNKIDEVEQVTAAALNVLNDRVSEDEEVTAAALNNLNDGVTTISGQVSANTSNISTVSAATASNTTALGGLSLVKLTQAQYDALSPNYDSNTLYVIT